MSVPTLAAAKSWHYQLQNIAPLGTRALAADLCVVDYEGDNGPFSAAQVAQMQAGPNGRRLVVAYMSIGEAESYRFYWPPLAGIVGAENPQWKGNYAAHFWDERWQAVIFSYLDRILAAGFDGVYLDKVDEFEDLGHADAMVAFVAAIAARAKAARPGFAVISQNGDALLPRADFRAAIDGFAREDLLYGEDDDGVANRPDSIADSIARLKLLTGEGKPVFVVEYVSGARGLAALEKIKAQGFVGLTAVRDLDRI